MKWHSFDRTNHPYGYCTMCANQAEFMFTSAAGDVWSAGIDGGEVWIIAHGPESQLFASKGFKESLSTLEPCEMDDDVSRWMRFVFAEAWSRLKGE